MGGRADQVRREKGRALRQAAKRCSAYRPTATERLTYNSPYSAYERLARECAESAAPGADKDAAAEAWKAFKATFRPAPQMHV